jgi:hypothetical protein
MKATVHIGTWNLHTNHTQIDFTHFIKHTLSPSPDFIVLGFQELQSQFKPCLWWEESFWSYSIENGQIRSGSKTITSLEEYIRMVLAAIDIAHGQGAKYRPLYAGRRTALGIFILVKQGVLVKKIYSGSIGTGLLGLYSNKGAIGVSLQVEFEKHPGTSISLCFISSHLGPHQGEEYCRWRREESDYILSSLQMYPLGEKEMYVLPESNQVIYFFGDLNFRLKGTSPKWSLSKKNILSEFLFLFQISNLLNGKGVDHKLVMPKIVEKDVEGILEHDELLFLRRHSLGMLSLFKEPRITFLPSYKLAPDRTYSMHRVPGYCDRILYTNSAHTITPLKYSRITEYTNSDHDPIIAMFLIEFTDQCKMTRRSGFLFKTRLLRFYRVNRAWMLLFLGIWITRIILL